MCFSATASFAASAGLSLLGISALRAAKAKHQIPLASIPLLFAVQQFAEGVVWISMTRSGWEDFQYPASYFFLVIAQIIWPIWFPVAFMRLETDLHRKKVLRLFIIPGVIVSAYFLYCLIFRPMTVSAEAHHVFYNIDFPPALIPFAAGFYLVATVIPPFLSRDLRIKAIGVILLASYFVARIFFQPSLISIWCFFSIGVSLLMFFAIRYSRKDEFLVS